MTDARTVLYVAAADADARDGAAALEAAGADATVRLEVDPVVDREAVRDRAPDADCVVFAETPTTAAGARLLEVSAACGPTPLVLFTDAAYGPGAARSTDGVDGYVRRGGEEAFAHLADEVAWVCHGRATDRRALPAADVAAARSRDAADADAILESLPVGAFTVDRGGRLAEATEWVGRTFDVDAAAVRGVPLETFAAGIAASDDAEALERAVSRILDGDADAASLDATVETSDGDLPLAFRIYAHEDAALVLALPLPPATEPSDRAADEGRRDPADRLERLEAFGDAVGHDLRNVVTLARGSLELAVGTGDPEHVAAVEEAHDRIEAAVEDLLAVTRHGAPVVDPEPVAVHDSARRAWAAVDAPGASLELERDGILEADRALLIEALEQLLAAAAERDAGGDGTDAEEEGERDADAAVAVRVGATPDGFFVADDGPETAAERECVLESDAAVDGDGAGPDLEVVAETARAHGWSVRLEESAAGGRRVEFRGARVERDGNGRSALANGRDALERRLLERRGRPLAGSGPIPSVDDANGGEEAGERTD